MIYTDPNLKECMVTVIVVNWNGRALIGDCLDSLKAQTFRKFSIIVVDNGSVDDSQSLIRSRYPEVRLIALDENRGFCEANNLALTQVNTPYAALLNNDGIAIRTGCWSWLRRWMPIRRPVLRRAGFYIMTGRRSSTGGKTDIPGPGPAS